MWGVASPLSTNYILQTLVGLAAGGCDYTRAPPFFCRHTHIPTPKLIPKPQLCQGHHSIKKVLVKVNDLLLSSLLRLFCFI